MKQSDTEWVRCEWEQAQEYRVRTLTGYIGLEGQWSEWKTGGRPKFWSANVEHQYRCTKEHLFLEKI